MKYRTEVLSAGSIFWDPSFVSPQISLPEAVFLRWKYLSPVILLPNGVVPQSYRYTRFWHRYPRFALNRFRYIRDPLFLISCALYALNRWMLKPHFHSPFIRGYFNDLLLIPCAIPLLLLVQRCLRLRRHDAMPAPAEVLFCLALWTLLFEWIGPRFIPGTTADPWDALAYTLGALFACAWWHFRPSRPSISIAE